MKKSLFSAIFLTLMASASVMTAQIQMTFSTVQPTCFGFSNGSATVFAVGGSGAYTYVWNTGQTTQTASGIGAGLYTVTVTDAVQNTASGSITLLEPTAVTAAITANNLNCAGTSGTLTATGFGGTPPYTYAWDGAGGPSSLETISVSAPGIYTVTVTDAHDCTGIEQFNVASSLLLEVVATDILCATNPNSGALNTIVSGGVGPYTYSWSNGSHDPSQTGVGAGPYICTVTSANGCIAIDSNYVDIPTILDVELVWLTPACGGNNNGSAIVEATGGTLPITYTWTPGPLNGPSQTGLAPNTYLVSTIDANSCQLDLEVVVPAADGLDVHLVVTSATCLGVDNATATAVASPAGSGYVYVWNILPQDSSVTQLTGLATGTVVSVTVTDPVSGCSGTATGTVGAHSTLEVTVTEVDILCIGGFGSATAVASNGTPQYTYTWFNGNGDQIGTEASIDSLNPGAYLVTVVDSLGCEGQAVADISILSDPHALIDGDSVLVCGDSLSVVQFSSLSFDTYNQITALTWHVTGPGLDTIIVQQTQVVFQLPVDENFNVQLIATSGLGCSDTTSLIFNVPGYPDLTLALDSTTLNCTGDSVAIFVIGGGDPSHTYVWNPAVTLDPDALHVLVNPSTTTTYVLTATDGNACTATASITIPPSDSLIQLTVAEHLIQTCEATATLSASTNIAADIVWTDPNGTVIPGNPITVPATPTTTIYTVTATTADNCILSDQVSVTGYGIEVSIDPTVSNTICEGDSLPLSVIVNPGFGNLTYQWSVNASAIILNPSSSNPILTGPAGDYTVRVIVGNLFCADTLEFPVQILPGFNLEGEISADLCKGLTVSFTNASGMAGVWDFGDNSPLSTEINPAHTYDTSGEFEVVFTPNSLQCTAPWDSIISVQQDTLTADVSSEYDDCTLRATIQFNGIANNPGAFNWDWSFSNGTPASSVDQNPLIVYDNEGIFIATLVVTDKNQCTATASDTVTVHIVNDEIESEQSICLGDSIQLNADGIDPNADYTWTATPADPGLNPNDPNPIVSPTVPTTYAVEINQGLCSVSYSVLVTINKGSDVSLPSDTVVCNTNLLPITAQSNSGTGFEWSNSPTFSNIFAVTQTVFLPPNGTYYVRTTNAAECIALDSITIALETVAIQVEPIDDNICLGEETVLFVTNLNPDQTLSYDWSPALPGVPSPIVSPTENTHYTVTVTNQFGCTSTLDFNVNVTTTSVDANVSPNVVTFADPTTVLDATTGGNGTVISYEWTPAGTLSDPNAPQTEASPTETTVYTVTTTTEEGCVATDTVTVFFRDSPCKSPFVFIPNAFSPNNDQKNDFFMVKADGMTELKMIIWNRWGEIVYETNDPATLGWDGSFRGKDPTPDSYAWYVVLTCGNGDVFESKGNVTLLK